MIATLPNCDLVQLEGGHWWCPLCDPEKQRLLPVNARRNCRSPEAVQTPSLARRWSSYRHARRRWKAAGRPIRSDETVARIHDLFCLPCEFYDAAWKNCKLCGCQLSKTRWALVNKIRMATESCPAGKWGAMPLTQLLSFELGSGCNLAAEHPKCPNLHPERYAHLKADKPLDDDAIVAIARRMHLEFGFCGLVGWHGYNEPLLEAERMFSLMHRLRAEVPAVRFLLWTNGTLLPADCGRFAAFERGCVSNYGPESLIGADRLARACPRVEVVSGRLDDRLDAMGDAVLRAACSRMFAEFVVDNFGNVRPCCYDWRGLASAGNVMTDDLGAIVARWESLREDVSGRCMANGAPEVCLRCRMRPSAVPVFDNHIADAAGWWLRTGLATGTDPTKPAVVFVHYRLPDSRLKEHFRWNGDLYRRFGISVFVVSDRPYPVPDYARCIIFPADRLPVVDGRARFSICATKNAGVRAAMEAGCGTIICSDVDIAFDPDTFARMAGVERGEAVAPVCWMAITFEDRDFAQSDEPMVNTVAMRAAEWLRCPYDERCVGYGSDDGILVEDIRAAGIALDRAGMVWHVAHESGTNQENFGGRTDFWNRADGFNFDNLERNKRLYEERRRAR